MKIFKNKNSVRKFLRDNVPNWRDNAVEINFRKHSGFEFIFVNQGKLKKITEDLCSIDRLIPKFIEYFEGKPWDDCTYYRPYYGRTIEEHIPWEHVYQISENNNNNIYETSNRFFSEFRNQFDDGQNYGFDDASKPKEFIVYVPGMFKNN